MSLFTSDLEDCFKKTGWYHQAIHPRLVYFSLEKNVLSLIGKIVMPKTASHYDTLEIIFSSEFSTVIF